MKGKATLILTDPQSGEEVKRIEETNMATRVSEKLLDIPRCGIFSEMNFPAILSGFLPRWEKQFGGIMLLGSNVDENKELVTPPEGFVPIGTAGGAYGGTDVHRGTLNLNETGPTENGYRLVWDFGTDRANGVIKCIGLTARFFGNIGFDADREHTQSIFCQPQYSGDSTTNAGTPVAMCYNGIFVCNVEPNEYITVGASGKDVSVNKLTLPDPDAITLGCTPSDVGTQTLAAFTLPFTVDIQTRFYDPDTNTVYFFSRESVDNGTDRITYVGIDLDTMTQGAAKSVTMENCNGVWLAVRRGKIYRYFGDHISVMDGTGAVLETIPAEEGSNAYFYVYDDHLYYAFSSGTGHFHARVDIAQKNGSAGIEGFPIYSKFVKAPYLLFSTRRSSNTQLFLMMDHCYMATINNLADPLEKTDRHALKIIYEISD